MSTFLREIKWRLSSTDSQLEENANSTLRIVLVYLLLFSSQRESRFAFKNETYYGMKRILDLRDWKGRFHTKKSYCFGFSDHKSHTVVGILKNTIQQPAKEEQSLHFLSQLLKIREGSRVVFHMPQDAQGHGQTCFVTSLKAGSGLSSVGFLTQGDLPPQVRSCLQAPFFACRPYLRNFSYLHRSNW